MTKNVLIDAVKNRTILTLVYDDKPRIIEPHAVGINPKGDLILRCYQRDGESATNPRAWKLLTADKIVDLQDTGQQFAGPRDGYKPGDKAMVDIFAELAA